MATEEKAKMVKKKNATAAAEETAPAKKVEEKKEEVKKEETALAKADDKPKAVVTEAESLEIRSQIRELKAKIDSTYFDLAGLLYKTYDNELYKQWGFDTFKDYVEDELGFGARKAQYLLGIWDYFVNEVGDPTVIEKIKPLGWTKAKELKDVVTAENVDEWVAKAGEMNVLTLAEAARAALRTPDFEDGEDGGKSSDPSEIEVAKTLSFKLFQEQFDNVNAALERAAELTSSTKKGHLLDSICTDYLAQNAFTSGGKEALAAFFGKFESQLGVRIFAIDTDKNTCTYGEDEGMKIIVVNTKEQEIVCGEATLSELVEEVDDGEAEGATATA